MSGYFISFEGTDGAGKSTQIKLLADRFEQKGFEVTVLREPGGTAIGEKIRNILIDKENAEMTAVTEALLYAAARAQLVRQVIMPALNNGDVVICDRFLDSSLVYQGTGRNLGQDVVENINAYAIEGLRPDITFFLKLDPEKGMKRKNEKAELDRIEAEGVMFQKRIYSAYLNLAKKNKDRIKVISADRSVEDIHEDIVREIETVFSKGL